MTPSQRLRLQRLESQYPSALDEEKRMAESAALAREALLNFADSRDDADKEELTQDQLEEIARLTDEFMETLMRE